MTLGLYQKHTAFDKIHEDTCRSIHMDNNETRKSSSCELCITDVKINITYHCIIDFTDCLVKLRTF